ncbi:MAG: hypothetical protein AAF639_25665 [Chloroflexota bacterium]
MKIYRNTTKIENSEKWGRRFSLTGLLILFAGLFASFVPNIYPLDQPAPHQFGAFLQQYWSFVSFVTLPGGFIFASLGSYFINRFARRRWPDGTIGRPDEVVEKSMKGFDNKYNYYAYSLPSNYVITGPCGIIPLIVRSDRGTFRVHNDRWREPFKLSRILTIFAREGVGNPSSEIELQKEKLTKLLNAHDEGQNLLDVPMSGAVVFLSSDVELDINNASIEVLKANKLKNFIRQRAKEVKLGSPELEQLNKFMANAAESVEALKR